MDKRTRLLTWLFAGVVGSLVVMNHVYPAYIQPLLTIDEENARLAQRLEELEEREARLSQARFDYRDYAYRVGSMDVDRVQNRVKKQLDELLLSHRIESGIVSPPRKYSVDKQTQISRLTFNLSGEGSLKQIVELLKEISQLPYLLAVNNPKLAPAGRSSKDRDRDAIELSCMIEVLVLPQHKQLDRLKDEDLRQPAQFVRYARSDYSEIWSRQPFQEFKEVVAVRPDPPKVVRAEPERDKPAPPPPPPPPPPDRRWRDRDQYRLTMALLMSDGASKFDEVMLYNDRSKENRYVRVGEDFDGGDLLFVHQRGVLVDREGERFIYPIGESLGAPLTIDEATDYPEIQLAARRFVPAPEPQPEAAPTNGEPTAATPTADGEAAVAKTEPAAEQPAQPAAGAGAGAPARVAKTPTPTTAPEQPVGDLSKGPVAPAGPDGAARTAILLGNDTAEDQPVDIGPDGEPVKPGESPDGSLATGDGAAAPRVALPPRTGSGPRARVTNPPAMRDGSTAPTAAGESSSAVLKQPGGLGTKGRLSSREALLNRPKGKPPAKPAEKAASEEEKNGEAKAEPETEKKSDE